MSDIVSFSLRVDEIWTVPGRPFPAVWGIVESGEVSADDQVDVETLDGSLVAGSIQAVEQHGTTATNSGRRVGLMISGDAADAVRHGSVVRGRS